MDYQNKSKISVLRRKSNSLQQEDDVTLKGLSEEDAEHLVHELRVHQLELAMQNEELLAAQVKIEQSRKKYYNLYNLAPVGFFTFNLKTGRIEDANPACARLLGIRSSGLRGVYFSRFIVPEFQDAFCFHKKRICESVDGSTHQCQLDLIRLDGTSLSVQLESVAIKGPSDTSRQAYISLADITRAKQAEEALKKTKLDLEARVTDRTYELILKNQELTTLNQQLLEENERSRRCQMTLEIQTEEMLAAYKQRNYLSRKFVELLERERHAIGRELHDEIGQTLTGVSMHLEGLKHIRTADGTDLSDCVVPIQELLMKAMKRARDISHSLRAEVLERFGLLPSIKNLLEDVQNHFNIKIHLFTKGIAGLASEDLKINEKDLTIYRIIQESLTNVVKYAETKEVFINLILREKAFYLSIEDNGKGFDYLQFSTNQDKDPRRPLGITIMRERVAMVGGVFRIESQPGAGTHVFAEIPAD